MDEIVATRACGRDRRRIAWLATAVLCVAVAGAPATVQAQDKASRQAATTFDIPAQDLGAALTLFSDRAGLRLLLPSSVVGGKRSAAVSGRLTREAALARLLSGTGLTYRFPDADTVTIIAAAGGEATAIGIEEGSTALGTIIVEGNGVNDWDAPPAYAGGQVAVGARVGALGNLAAMDTPFNQTGYTAKHIQNTQAATVAEALQDNSSVRTLVNGDRSSYFEQVTIRGLPISSYNYLFDGLPGILPYNSTAAELAERVEVLSGPSALINGMPPDGAVGGTVNLVPKRAGEEPLTEFTTFYRGAGVIGEHIDIGRRYGDSQEFGVRFNGVYSGGETNISDQDKHARLASFGLDYKGDRLRLSADLGYQSNTTDNATISNFYLADGLSVPPAMSGRDQAVSPWSYSDTSGRFAMIHGEFDATEDLTFYGAYGASGSLFDTNTLVSHTILNTDGDFLAMPYRVDAEMLRTSLQTGVRWRFDTGPVAHRVALQYDRSTEDADIGLVIGAAPIFSNLDDLSTLPDPGLKGVPRGRQTEGTYSGISALYTMSLFDERLLLMGGLRKQYVETRSYDVFTHVPSSSYSDDALSPTAAFVVKPWENVSFYANYAEGLSPGIAVPIGYANAGAILPTYKTRQLEAGVKAEWGDFTTTLSLFDITQPSQRLDTATNVLGVDGEQRNRGIEFNFFGEVAENVRLLGGLLLLDPRLTKTTGGLDDGKVAVGSSRLQANIGAEWDMPSIPGLSLGGRLTFTGAQYYETAEPRREIPSWTRLDLGGRYTIEREGAQPIVIRFNVDNALDTEYWASTTHGLIAGEARTFKLSTTFRF